MIYILARVENCYKEVYGVTAYRAEGQETCSAVLQLLCHLIFCLPKISVINFTLWKVDH